MEEGGSAFNKSEKSFDEQDCAPVETFISPSELPKSTKGFKLPLRAVKALNILIARAWNGRKAELDVQTIVDAFHAVHFTPNVDALESIIFYAEHRGWTVRTIRTHPNPGHYFRFTPK